MSNTLKVGMVGYKFMGKAHSNALSRLPMFFPTDRPVEMRAICGRDETWVKQAAKDYGWQSVETDYRRLVAREDIDVIDITAPSNAHKDIAIAAARAGKHVFCEKPLALNLADAREMLQAVQAAGVKHQIGFNYRFAPALILAKRMIEEGRLGKIFHFRGVYLQDWIVDPEFPKVWRLDKAVAGSGSLGDLGAHVIDMARYLVGDIARVTGMSKTFVTQRPLVDRMSGLSAAAAKDAPMGEVDVDDATLFVMAFHNGALGTIEATRFAQGHKNDMSFEVNGEKGSLRFSLERINELEYFNAQDEEGFAGFRTLQITEGVHPYMEHWWPAGHVIGYEHTFVHELYEFSQAILQDRKAHPGFEDGVACCQVMEAVEQSIETQCWVEVDSL